MSLILQLLIVCLAAAIQLTSSQPTVDISDQEDSDVCTETQTCLSRLETQQSTAVSQLQTGMTQLQTSVAESHTRTEQMLNQLSQSSNRTKQVLDQLMTRVTQLESGATETQTRLSLLETSVSQQSTAVSRLLTGMTQLQMSITQQLSVESVVTQSLRCNVKNRQWYSVNFCLKKLLFLLFYLIPFSFLPTSTLTSFSTPFLLFFSLFSPHFTFPLFGLDSLFHFFSLLRFIF